jgi:DNA ligase D-like protein (predicted 3'-phosphoesterase)
MKHILFIILFLGFDVMAAKSTLKTYRARRGLSRSSVHEPYGSITKKKTQKPLFVIQKHDASHLHYDFRIEIDGVLKSWAVPKGLPEKRGIRRLALPTDDHPMEYAHFEGIIPQGHYGGGTVMVWDIGTFENIKKENGVLVPLKNCYKKGTIEIFLKGKKIWGPYALIRTHGLSNKESWIILRMSLDKQGEKSRKIKVKKEVSALSGRTMKEIADDADAVWE